jgi:hypothetical protein
MVDVEYANDATIVIDFVANAVLASASPPQPFKGRAQWGTYSLRIVA